MSEESEWIKNFRNPPPNRFKRKKISPTNRRKLMMRAGGSCEQCHRAHGLRIHHRIHVSHGGTNEMRNLQVLCEACEDAEHGRTTMLRKRDK